MVPIDVKAVHCFFWCTLQALVLVSSAPLAVPRSFADKVYPLTQDVRKLRDEWFERRGEYDSLMGSVDRNWPTEAMGKCKRDVSMVSMHVYVK